MKEVFVWEYSLRLEPPKSLIFNIRYSDWNNTMDQKIPENLKVVVLECPYNTLLTDQRTKKVFSDYINFKLTGFLKEYPHGILPLNSYDFISNIVLLCEENGTELDPVLGFKSIPLDRCNFFNLPFEVFQIINKETSPAHEKVVQQIISNALKNNKKIGYNSSWTISPRWRATPDCKAFAREFSISLFTNYYQTYEIPEILIGGAVRFKVDKIQGFMGFKDLVYNNENLPPIDCPFLRGEKTQVMHLSQFSAEALEIADRYKCIWDNRLVIGDDSKVNVAHRVIAA